jgi:transcription elongation factor Elf1
MTVMLQERRKKKYGAQCSCLEFYTAEEKNLHSQPVNVYSQVVGQ